MSAETAAASDGGPFAPAAACIKFGADGAPYVEGHRCDACRAVYAEPRFACAKCGARGGFTAFRAATTGRLHTYSIVARSYPGVPVPFVSAIVDLDDGLVLKGNLLDVAPDPRQIAFGTAVDVVFDQAPGQQAKDGRPFMAYFFKPRTGKAQIGAAT